MPAKLHEAMRERIQAAILNGEHRKDAIERLGCRPGSYDNVRATMVKNGVKLKHNNTGRPPGRLKPKTARPLKKTAFTAWGYLSYV